MNYWIDYHDLKMGRSWRGRVSHQSWVAQGHLGVSWASVDKDRTSAAIIFADDFVTKTEFYVKDKTIKHQKLPPLIVIYLTGHFHLHLFADSFIDQTTILSTEHIKIVKVDLAITSLQPCCDSYDCIIIVLMILMHHAYSFTHTHSFINSSD